MSVSTSGTHSITATLNRPVTLTTSVGNIEIIHGNVDDVKVDGVSVVTNRVANINLTGKQDVITDLDTIRAGAAAGSTAVQPAAISDMATKTWVEDQDYLTDADLEDYSTTEEMSTAIAAHHDSSKQDTISDLQTIREGANAGSTAVQPSAISDMATKTWTEEQGYLTEHQSLAAYSTTAQMNEAINTHHDSTKQDTISDLETIRSGAGLGTTAVQPSAISDMATQTWVEGKGYLTEHQSLAAYSTTTEMNTAIAAHHDSTKQDTISDLETIRSGASAGATAVQPSAISDMATKTWTEAQGYLTEHQPLTSYATKTWVEEQNYYTGTPVEDVKLNGTTVVDNNHVANISTVDNVTSAGNQNPLSANQGKLLNDRLNNLEAIGTYLAVWDSNRGLPTTDPTTMPYTYKTGCYYRIGLLFAYKHTIHYLFNSSDAYITVYTDDNTALTHIGFETWLRTNGYKEESTSVGPLAEYTDIVGSYSGDLFKSCYVVAHDGESSGWELMARTVGGTLMEFASTDFVADTVTSANKYKPVGTQYTGIASSTFDTTTSMVGDFWFYDGSIWSIMMNHAGSIITDVQQNGISVVSGGVANITVPTVPTNVSAFTNDAGYITNAYHDSTKQDALPTVVNDRYLHTNETTGALEWSEAGGTITEVEVNGTSVVSGSVASINLKTVNNNELTGTGNISIPKGDTGAAAGFGTPTASADSSIGTPSVVVTATGEDTAKVFDFAFHNIKGETGATGATGAQGDPGSSVTFGSDSDIVVEETTGTVVEANPSTTTDTLTGIKIGDTSYAVGGGSSVHLYRHDISISYNGSIYTSIINTSETPYTASTILDGLPSNYIAASGTTNTKLITGIKKSSSSGYFEVAFVRTLLNSDSTGYYLQKAGSAASPYIDSGVDYVYVSYTGVSDSVTQLI